MWTEDANSNELINTFTTLMEKETPSRGSFIADFEVNLSNFSVIRCPFVNSSLIDESERVAVTNAKIDISNWRAMLLSTITVGSRVKEIYVHGCQLSHQHVSDLAAIIPKISKPISLIIQYCTFDGIEESIEKYADCFAGLFQESPGIEFISLKGNMLADKFLSKVVPIISANQRLKGLSLSENQLTDEFTNSLLNGLRFSHSLQSLSLSGNSMVNSSTFSIWLGYQIGIPATANDEATIKSMIKTIADKNKAVKELNKKRKKANLPDVEEIASLPEFIKTLDVQKLFVNSSLKFIDVSDNNFDYNEISSILENSSNLQRIVEAGARVVISSNADLRTNTCEGWLILN